MAIRFPSVVGGLALTGLLACGALVSLDQVDPATTSSIQSDDGGVSGTGSTTAGGVTISPTTIDMPSVRCGVTKTVPITLTNTNAAPADYQISVPSTTSFQLQGVEDGGSLTGSIPGKSSTVLNLVGLGNAAGNDAVTIVVSVGGDVKQINATIEREGGSLTISPTSLAFGEVRMENGSTPTDVVFQNDGNAPITIKSFTVASGASADQFTTPVNITIDKNGGTAKGTFVLKPAAAPDTAEISATFTPAIDDAFCGPIPTIALSGQRVNSAVTVTPATQDFGKIGCETSPPTTHSIIVSNYSPQYPVNYTATLPSPSHFKFVPGTDTGTVPVSTDSGTTPMTSPITLAVLPVGDGFGDFNEQLTVTTTVMDGSGSPPTKTTPISLTINVYGAQFTVVPNDPAVANINSGDTKFTQISNVGNADSCVSFSVSNGFDSQPFTIIRGKNSANLPVDFNECTNGTTGGKVAGTVTLKRPSGFDCIGNDTNVPLCGALPTLTVGGVLQKCHN